MDLSEFKASQPDLYSEILSKKKRKKHPQIKIKAVQVPIIKRNLKKYKNAKGQIIFPMDHNSQIKKIQK